MIKLKIKYFHHSILHYYYPQIFYSVWNPHKNCRQWTLLQTRQKSWKKLNSERPENRREGGRGERETLETPLTVSPEMEIPIFHFVGRSPSSSRANEALHSFLLFLLETLALGLSLIFFIKGVFYEKEFPPLFITKQPAPIELTIGAEAEASQSRLKKQERKYKRSKWRQQRIKKKKRRSLATAASTEDLPPSS